MLRVSEFGFQTHASPMLEKAPHFLSSAKIFSELNILLTLIGSPPPTAAWLKVDGYI